MDAFAGRPRALLGWEFGSGFEHVRRLLDIAGKLLENGWEPVLALRELAQANNVLKAGIRVLQAPVTTSQTVGVPKFRSGSYGEIIAAFGFGDLAATRVMCAAWDEIIAYVNPRVIVADYSPFLSLAAYKRIPVVAIGDGFVQPPSHLDKFLLLHEKGTRPFDHSKVLATINALQEERGAPHIQRAPAILGDSQIVCTYPELDMYSERRSSSASGPLGFRAPRMEKFNRHRVFFYLAADFEPTWRVIEALASSSVEAHGFIRSASKERLAQFSGSNLTFYDQPQPIIEALQNSSAVIHHGGVGTSEVALAAGRPQMLVPRHLEQTLNAKSMMKHGVAVTLVSPFTKEAAASALDGLQNKPSIYAAARKLSEKIASRDHDRSMQLIMSACEAAALSPQTARGLQ